MQLLSHFLDQLSPICLEQWHQNIWFQAFHPKIEEDWNSLITSNSNQNIRDYETVGKRSAHEVSLAPTGALIAISTYFWFTLLHFRVPCTSGTLIGIHFVPQAAEKVVLCHTPCGQLYFCPIDNNGPFLLKQGLQMSDLAMAMRWFSISTVLTMESGSNQKAESMRQLGKSSLEKDNCNWIILK